MKYIKFTQVSAETGISWAIDQPISGPVYPNIPGLNLSTAIKLSTSPFYYIGTADDSVEPNPNNHLFVLTEQEYAQELKDHVLNLRDKEIENCYKEEIEFREDRIKGYHMTALIAGSLKYRQAVEYLQNNQANVPELIAEAVFRGVSPLTLAQRIINNHNELMAFDVKVAGIRGKIVDRLVNYTFNLNEYNESYQEFLSTEVIGQKMSFERDENTGEMVQKMVDVVVPKYKCYLATRFEFA